MKCSSCRKIQLFWAYFIAIGAVLGTMMFIVDSSGLAWGMEPLLPILREGLPMVAFLFNDFIASGVALMLFVGVPNMVSIVLMHLYHRLAMLSALFSGVLLLLWILLEFYIWGFVSLSIPYFFFSLLQIGNAIWWIMISHRR